MTAYTGTIKVLENDFSLGIDPARTNRCLRLGFTRRQGLGFSECDGAGFPFPSANADPVRAKDSRDYDHLFVINDEDGLIYDLATYKGPTGSGVEEVWTDGQVGTSPGVAIAPLVTFRADRAGENKLIKSEKHNFGVRPYREEFRGADGYDANGYPDDLAMQLDMYVDGERTTAEATAEDVAVPKHTVRMDRMVRGNEIMSTLSANKAPFSLVSRDQNYIAEDIDDAPQNMVSSEDAYQQEFATPSFWLSRYGSEYLDRVTGAAESLSGLSFVTGPGGAADAVQMASGKVFSTKAATGGTILIWATDTIVLKFGATAVSLTAHGTNGGWTLYYANTTTASGALTIEADPNVSVFDIRAFSANISTKARTYYYNDVVNNGGAIMVPGI